MTNLGPLSVKQNVEIPRGMTQLSMKIVPIYGTVVGIDGTAQGSLE